MYMRAFAEAYPEASIVQQLVGQLPWGHNIILIEKIKDAEHRLWYARQTIQEVIRSSRQTWVSHIRPFEGCRE